MLLASCKEGLSPNRIVEVSIVALTSTTLLVGPAGGQTVQLVAKGTTAKGDEVAVPALEWSTATPGIISVSATGRVTALAVGAGIVTARSARVEGEIAINVLPVPVATLSLTPDPLALEVSPLGAGNQQLAALLQDSTGSTLPGRTITWSSTAPTVATVSPSGPVTAFVAAVGAGSAYIRAFSEGKADSVAVTVTVTTTLPAGIDLSIADAIWTQGAQTAEGTIPILRNGRAAVLLVRTTAGAEVAAPNQFVLRFFTSTGVRYRTDTATALVPLGVTSFTLPTAQFLVPTADLQPGMRWEVERDPKGVIVDANAANDLFPRAGHQPLNLITPPTLRLRFVPISLSAHGGVTGNVSGGNLDEYLRLVRTFIPHGEVETSIAAAFPVSTSYGTAPQGGGQSFWTSLIAQLDAARVADPTYADAHWVGVVAPPAGFNFASFGGWGYIPGNGASYGPATRTFALVNVGWFTRESASRELMAHELGHNLGRFHAPCGNAAGPDVNFPNPGGVVGSGAHNTYAWQLGAASSAVAVDQTFGDTMGYCTNGVWASTYTYGGMLAFRGETGAAIVASAPRQRVLLVQGHVEGGEVRIDAQRVITAQPTESVATGEWTLEGRDRDGNVVFTQRFELGRYGESEGSRPFAVTVRMDDRTTRALSSLHVRGARSSAELRVP